MLVIKKADFYIFIFEQKFYPKMMKDKFVSNHIIKKGLRYFISNIKLSLSNLKINREGKPSVNGGLFFNFTHSGEYCALVVSEKPVGIDIEQTKDRDVKMISERIFGKELEKKEFYREWTRLESKAKLYGLNLFDRELATKNGEFFTFKFKEYYLTVCI